MKIRTSISAMVVSALMVLGMSAQGQTDYFGSGTTGFGGPIGESEMTWNDDGTTISVTFTKGTGDFNDAFVIYLSTGASGRSVIGTDVNDREGGDALRRAISFSSVSDLTFASGFEATHAIAINTSFGGLWSIPSTGSVGNNELPFVAGVSSTLSAADQASFTFSFNVADIGVTPNSGAAIQFVATYLNPFGNSDEGFASNEGYGSGFPGSNIGGDSFTFTGSEVYTIVPEPGTMALLGLGLLGVAAMRRRMN